MTATLAPPRPAAAAVALEAESVEAAAPVRPPRRGRRLLRLILGFAAILLLGNLVILAAHGYARNNPPTMTVHVPADVAAIRNFEAVDGTLWRGGAPGADDY